MYNSFDEKSQKGESSYEVYQNSKEQNNKKNSKLVFEGTNRNIRSNGTLGNRGIKNRKNGEKVAKEIQEVDTQIQSRNNKNKETAYENEEKNLSKIWNDERYLRESLDLRLKP